jgi:hypothetical protein
LGPSSVQASPALSATDQGAGRGNLSVDGAPDGRRYRGELVVREVNCRHGPDIIGRHLFSKEMFEVPEPGVSTSVQRLAERGSPTWWRGPKSSNHEES